jgi:hypothetical protein
MKKFINNLTSQGQFILMSACIIGGMFIIFGVIAIAEIVCLLK